MENTSVAVGVGTGSGGVQGGTTRRSWTAGGRVKGQECVSTGIMDPIVGSPGPGGDLVEKVQPAGERTEGAGDPCWRHMSILYKNTLLQKHFNIMCWTPRPRPVVGSARTKWTWGRLTPVGVEVLHRRYCSRIYCP